MASLIPRCSLAALAVGLAAVGCAALAGGPKAESPAVEAAPADAQEEIKARIKRVMAARERLTWVSIEDQGHTFRGVYDDGSDRWIQFWHSPLCPACKPAGPVRPGAWASGE